MPQKRLAITSVVLAGVISGLSACDSGKTPEELVQGARDYLAAGNNAAASIELKNAVLQAPNNMQARLMLGQTYFAMGEYALAEKELRAARELGAADDDTLGMLVRSLLVQQKYDDIIGETAFISMDLKPEVAGNVLGILTQAYVYRGKFQEAQFSLDEAMEFTPPAPEALLGQALLAMYQGDLDAARKANQAVLDIVPELADGWSQRGLIEQGAGNYEDSLAAYDKAIELRTASQLDAARRALSLVYMGEYQRARKDAEALLNRGMTEHPLPNYVIGLSYFQEGEFADAEGYLKVAVSGAPDFLEGKVYLLLTYYEIANYEQAHQLANQLMNTLPNNPLSSRILSAIYSRGGNYDRALQTLRDSLSQNPEDANILRSLGLLELAKGDAKKAVEYYTRLQPLERATPADREMLILAKLVAGEPLGKDLRGANVYSSESLQLMLLYAIDSLKQGNIEDGREIGEQLMKAHPNQAEPIYVVASSYVLSRDWANARRYLEEGRTRDPAHFASSQTLAQVELNEGNVDRAIEILQDYLTVEGGQKLPQIYALLSDARLQQGDEEEALRTLELGLNSYPGNPTLTRALAEYMFQRGDMPGVTALLVDIAEFPGPVQPGMLELKGKAAMLTADIDTAEQAFQKWATLQPDSPKPDHFLGDVRSRQNRHAEALEKFAKAINKDADYLAPQLGRANSQIALRRVDAAEATLQAIDKRFASTADIQWTKGRLAMVQGDFDKAVFLFKSADESIELPNLTLNLARAQWQAGQQQQALATLDSWLEQHPNDTPVRLERAANRLERGETSGAIADYEQVLKVQPNYSLVLNNLAGLYFPIDPELSLEYARRALEVAPDTPVVKDTVGMILVESGSDPVKGLKLLEEATLAVPDFPEFRMSYARALRLQGQRSESDQQLQVVVDLAPESAIAEEARQIMQSRD